jgi:uncharacterized protein (DUF1778 family)
MTETEHLTLSAEDSIRVLDMLENPPKPNAKLRAAIATLPKPESQQGEPGLPSMKN